MSKYTTEVRYICEHEYGLKESRGANSVDEILDGSWDKIFTTKVEFFDESYRKFLCKKILKHYYTREIGAETVGLWKMWVNTKLEEIMPYYNKMYLAELIKFDPMTDVNYKRVNTGTSKTGMESTQNSDGTRTTNGHNSNTKNNSNTRRDLYSDTPQGAITGLENENYLTNARKITDSGNETNTATYNETVDNVDEIKGVSETNNKTDFEEVITGKQGSSSFTKLLMEYRKSLINIDMLVIKEFSDCFMGVW